MEAEYEVIEQRDNNIKLRVSLPGKRHMIQHSIPVRKVNRSDLSTQEYIEETVARIANRHCECESIPDDELPSDGRVEFEPGPQEPREVKEAQKNE
jgi:hypothetical protein